MLELREEYKVGWKRRPSKANFILLPYIYLFLLFKVLHFPTNPNFSEPPSRQLRLPRCLPTSLPGFIFRQPFNLEERDGRNVI